MKIGLFDSGIGGLSVLAPLIRMMPDEEYIYYADSDNVPYGTKSEQEIYRLSKAAIDFLLGKGCDIICIACNTATSAAAGRLRNEYELPIVGVEPAVKPAISHLSDDGGNGRILVIATPMTVKQKKLQDLVARLDDEHLVDMKALGKLPEFAEQGDFDSRELQDYLDAELSGEGYRQYTKVVLGCTHFIHFTEILTKYFAENVEFLDGSEGTARNICRICEQKGFSHGTVGAISYYRSGREASGEGKLFYEKILERLKK